MGEDIMGRGTQEKPSPQILTEIHPVETAKTAKLQSLSPLHPWSAGTDQTFSAAQRTVCQAIPSNLSVKSGQFPLQAYGSPAYPYSGTDYSPVCLDGHTAALVGSWLTLLHVSSSVLGRISLLLQAQFQLPSQGATPHARHCVKRSMWYWIACLLSLSD